MIRAAQNLQGNFPYRSRNVFKVSWSKFLAMIILMLGIGFSFLYFFKIYFILIVITVICVIGLILRFKKLKKIRLLNQFTVPDEIWHAFWQRHPQVDVSSYISIQEGFKDYLAIHILHKNAYAMPSHSVDALWHVLIEEFHTFYQVICQNFLGYELLHKPHDPIPTQIQKISQKKQLLSTWQMTCHLHGLDPKNTKRLPRLFSVDDQIHWEKGLMFSLPAMIGIYTQMMKSDTHSSSTVTTSSCASATTHMHSLSSSSSYSSDSCTNTSHDSSHSHSHSCSDSSSSCSSCSSGGGGD